MGVHRGNICSPPVRLPTVSGEAVLLYVIGIGYRPLQRKAREIILRSDSILASTRLYEVFRDYEEFNMVVDKITVIDKIDQTMEYIRSRLQDKLEIVLLASGDPLFFGIGRRCLDEFGREDVEIIPDLSSIQLAFSRIKEPWDDAFLMSLHGGPDPAKRRRLPYEISDIPWLLKRHNKIAILTDRENNPSVIAKGIRNSKVRIYVCERLGYPDERVIEGRPEEIAHLSFREPNVVIVKREEGLEPSPIITSPPIFGLKEDEIIHSRGLITKDEVRAIVIHKLRLPRIGGVIFWDIGAGSGSISIEIARAFPEIKVFAIERDPEQIKNIRANRASFGLNNIEIIDGEAPSVLKDLPAPQRIFIGGHGGRLGEIIDEIDRKISTVTSPPTVTAPPGDVIVVINATTLETLNTAVEVFTLKEYEIDLVQISISRLKMLGRAHHLSAENPVFVITGKKKRK